MAAQTEPAPGTPKCTRCSRRLKKVVIVNHLPYGTTCSKKIHEPVADDQQLHFGDSE